MALKFLYYFIFIFIVITIFLLFQKPYNVAVNSDSKDKPYIELNGVTSYSITQDGIEHIVNASKVLRFIGYDKFFDVDAIRKAEDGVRENLKADNGKLIKDDFSLKGNVVYSNSENVKYKSQVAQYNLKTKVFKTDADFVIEDNSSKVYGTSLVYMTTEGKIYANNIKSIVEVEDK